MKKPFIVVRGGGDIATGTIHTLWTAGLIPVVLETDKPSAIRRRVSVCEAVYDGESTVDGMKAVRAYGIENVYDIINENNVPVLTDEKGESIQRLAPDILIDGILAKRNINTHIRMAPLTIALGPGFRAGVDVHYVIETQRGHDLGRIIEKGSAAKNTGIPGNIGGYTAERVIHSPADGIIKTVKDIGSFVEKNDIIALVGNEGVPASLTGIIRGIIRDGYSVHKGLKIADIDPRREEYGNCFTVSDKARCIGGSVLRLVCRFMVDMNEKDI